MTCRAEELRVESDAGRLEEEPPVHLPHIRVVDLSAQDDLRRLERMQWEVSTRSTTCPAPLSIASARSTSSALAVR